MPKQQYSFTAAGIALVRAIESEKPVNERICHDLYARQFVPLHRWEKALLFLAGLSAFLFTVFIKLNVA